MLAYTPSVVGEYIAKLVHSIEKRNTKDTISLLVREVLIKLRRIPTSRDTSG